MSKRFTMQKGLRFLRWLGFLVLTFALVLAFRLPAIAETPRPYNELTFPPLPEITIPKYERYQLDNGMVIYLMEDHQLPLIQGSAIIRTGSRFEPADKLGLAEITGTLLRIGGTEKYPAAQLNEMLEQKAAIVDFSIGTTSGTASFNVLKEDVEDVFGLLAQMLRYPAFASNQLELAKTQQMGEISRRNDDPKDIASREFRKLIYGSDSPYARTVEYVNLDNISRDDVISFYQEYIRPDQIILGIVGDFDPQKMKQIIKNNFADWQSPTKKPDLSLPPVSQKNTGGVFFVEQPQLTQSNVLLGHLGGELNNPDYPYLSVLNEVLNGMSGRLFNELRSRQGLAYSVYGVWQASYDYPGIFVAGGQTSSETTVAFVQSLLKEIERIRNNPITEEELAMAKESMLNSFIFKFENPGQTLSRLMTYEYYGYPKDFIFQYQKAVKETTVEDIQRVAQKYLHPEKMLTLVVGNSQGINPPLKSLSPEIKTVDITIPEPKS